MKMTLAQFQECRFSLLGLQKGLELLSKEKRFPAFNLELSCVEVGEKKAVKFGIRCYSSQTTEYDFTRLYFYEMNISEEVKNNPGLNWRKARVMDPWQVVDYNEWIQDLNALITELQIKYPAVNDLPAIIEKIILPDLLKN